MEQIVNFLYLYADALNEHPNILDRTPKGITWSFQGKTYKRENLVNRLRADYSKKNNTIAVVEAPYSEELNRAYIINAKNEFIISDLRELLFSHIQKICLVEGVICQDSEFIFHLNIRNDDYSIPFDMKTRTFGKLTQSR